MGRVLVVEDDLSTAKLIAEAVAQLGHVSDIAADGSEGERRACNRPYDLLIVDRMLPEQDGLTMVQRLRAAHVSAPVLFLSAMGNVGDRVQGLDGGGDDYLPKPYDHAELLARVAALLRRGERATTRLVCADLELDLLSRTARRAGRDIDLLSREFQILEVLMRHAGQAVTRAMLLEAVWNYHFDPGTNIVDVHISHLRRKIDGGAAEPLLETVTGSGYRLRAPSR
jgi:two-component system OmpR family response regulator